MTTSEEEPINPLDAMLDEAWKDVMGDAQTSLPDETLELSSSDEIEEPVVDEEPSLDPEEPEVEVAEPVEEEIPVEEPAYEAPDNWSENDRTMFQDLDEGAKEFLLRRHKEMEGDYTRKTQEVSEAVELNKLLNEGLDPAVKAGLTRQGYDNKRYLAEVMDWHMKSIRDPAAFLRDAARQMNIDPATVFPSQPQERKTLTPEEERLAATESYIQQDQAEKQRRATEEAHRMVNEFKDAKSESGEILHPHFEQVRGDMAALVTAQPQMSWDRAYKVAVGARDDLTTPTPEPTPTPTPVTADRVTKARKAQASNLRSKSGAKSTVKEVENAPMSMDEAMNAAADEIGF